MKEKVPFRDIMSGTSLRRASFFKAFCMLRSADQIERSLY